MRISGWDLLVICHHTDKFADYGHGESGDMFLTCHMTSPDHMFKGLYVNLWVRAFHCKLPPCQVGGYWSWAIGDIKHLICQKILQNYVIEGSYNFMCWKSSLYATPWQP